MIGNHLNESITAFVLLLLTIALLTLAPPPMCVSFELFSFPHQPMGQPPSQHGRHHALWQRCHSTPLSDRKYRFFLSSERAASVRATATALHNSQVNTDRQEKQEQERSEQPRKHEHTLAILTMPESTSARIANEAILQTAMSVTTRRLSVVLRTNTGGTSSLDGEGHSHVTLTQLRRYAGEIYSMAWDAALGLDERENNQSDLNRSGEGILAGPITRGGRLLDLIVYPQNMPNTPPEGWIADRPDLSCLCSHDSITGWITSGDAAAGSGRKYADKEGQGQGGLGAHVSAVNAVRAARGLKPVVALHVDDWPDGAEVTGDPNVVFLEDDDAFEKLDASRMNLERGGRSETRVEVDAKDGFASGGLIGGTSIPPSSLYSSVAVGGTFDGMHYGHRKLLTLAISSVQPINGRLLIGVTRDEMLASKAFADRIPPLQERIDGVLDFIGNLAPGMKNRIRAIPINDEYGPPGHDGSQRNYPGIKNDFDALVLSHETLPTGRKLNSYRENVLGLEPLKLLCTQRTEPHGMSSTTLRRMRSKDQS